VCVFVSRHVGQLVWVYVGVCEGECVSCDALGSFCDCMCVRVRVCMCVCARSIITAHNKHLVLIASGRVGQLARVH